MSAKSQLESLVEQIEAIDASWQDLESGSLMQREQLLKRLAQRCAVAPQEAISIMPALEALNRATIRMSTQIEAIKNQDALDYQEALSHLRQLQRFDEPEGNPPKLLNRLG